MQYRIEVRYQNGIPDAEGRGIAADVIDLGITGVEEVSTARIYWIVGDLSREVTERICADLLVDAVTQTYRCTQENSSTSPTAKPDEMARSAWIVDVQYRPGVTDAVGDSVMKGIRDMGIQGVREVHTGHQYTLCGHGLTRTDVDTIGKRLLANELIQTISVF